MYFGRLLPWRERSPRSSKRYRPGKNKAKRDKKAKTFKHESSSDNDSNSDNEGITTNERHTNSPFQGLGNGLRDVASFLVQVLSNPHVLYLMPFTLLAFVGIQVHNWLASHAPGGGFSGNLIAMCMAQPGAAWPMVIVAIIDVAPAVLNWWSADSYLKTTSTIPQVRFLSPISAEEAFVIPEYLTTLKSSIVRLNVMGGDSGLSSAMEDSFRRAMKEAELFKEISDGLMTDFRLRFAGHYDQLGQLHVDIERAIIDIADRNETKTSYCGGWLTTDRPYTRARSHHRVLLSITNDMIKASEFEMKLLRDYLRKLEVFVTKQEHHGAICGLRSNTLKSIQRWTKETKDIRAGAKVMCNSSKRSNVKLRMTLDALKQHLASIDAVRKALSALQHDRAKTLETALLSYCKSLPGAMQRLAEFGNR